MMTRALLLSLALSGSAILFCDVADAAKPVRTTPEQRRALDLFEQSAQSYREGRFQEAVDKLLEARKLKPEPVLLYNLGRAYEALGKSEEAADAYSQYLSEEPSPNDRKAIEARITTLRAQAAELAAARRAGAEAKQEPPPPPLPPKKEEPTKAAKDDSGVPAVVPWIVTGTGAAVLVTGFILGAVAQGQHDDAVSEREQRAAVEKQDSAEGMATASTVTIIVGAILATAGVGWLVYRSTSSSSSSTASAGALRWTF